MNVDMAAPLLSSSLTVRTVDLQTLLGPYSLCRRRRNATLNSN